MEWLAEKILKHKLLIIICWVVMFILCLYSIPSLRFSFDLEQLFPQGDEELAFYEEFSKDFKKDDSYLLVIPFADSTVFDRDYLTKIKAFADKARQLSGVLDAQSLATMKYPVKTPFGMVSLPFLHIDEPTKYSLDELRIFSEDKIIGQWITRDTGALVIHLTLEDGLDLDDSQALMHGLNDLASEMDLDSVRYMGRPYLQTEMVALQRRELQNTTFYSGILVTLVLFLVFQRVWSVLVVVLSVGFGFVLFLGYMAFFGRELNILSALYPLLMVIIGTSDVIHMLNKYFSALRVGLPKDDAIRATIKEIGWATLLTSATTAAGYFSLLTNRIYPIQDFGMNSAIGVMIAYLTVISFTMALLFFLPSEKMIKTSKQADWWESLLMKWYMITKERSTAIILTTLLLLFVALYGISRIKMNFDLDTNLPKTARITQDYYYTQDNLYGFKPIQFAIFSKDGKPLDRYEHLRQIDLLERYLDSLDGVIDSYSINDFYRRLHRAYHGNQKRYYTFPDNPKDFKKYKRQLKRLPESVSGIFINQERNKLKLTVQFEDLGSERHVELSEQIDRWIEDNLDLSKLIVRQTGTGYLLDRNTEYVIRGLFYGLAIAIVVVSLLMMFLFQNTKLTIISLVPNLIPLILAGAALGFLGIDLDAGLSIVFAITFGIAVDDTIHFLSKFKICYEKTGQVELSIKQTFLQTGKAIILTTVILFFGFMVLLFSNHPPSYAIGILLSFSLVSALVVDLMLLPILLRSFLDDRP